VWVDSDQPSLLRTSINTEAEDFNAAIALGVRRSMKRSLPRLWTAGRSA
jgi:hypothetical protein